MKFVHLLPRNRAFFFVLICLLFETQQLQAQQLGQGTNEGEVNLWRVVAALVVCVLTAVAGAYMLRSRIGGGISLRPRIRSRRLQLVETLRVGPHNNICIVSCDEEEMLIALSSQNIRLLRPIPPQHDNPVL